MEKYGETRARRLLSTWWTILEPHFDLHTLASVAGHPCTPIPLRSDSRWEFWGDLHLIFDLDILFATFLPLTPMRNSNQGRSRRNPPRTTLRPSPKRAQSSAKLIYTLQINFRRVKARQQSLHLPTPSMPPRPRASDDNDASMHDASDDGQTANDAMVCLLSPFTLACLVPHRRTRRDLQYGLAQTLKSQVGR